MRRVILGCLILALTGCGTIRPAVAPTPERTPAALVGGVWTAAQGNWSIRQSAVFELRGARVPMSGLLLLDTGRQEARIAGLNDLGVKLFEMTVRPAGEDIHFLLPELARLPGAGAAVADSVRRIFLAPRPASGDRARVSRKGIELARTAGGKDVRFLFGGADAELQETRVRGDGEDWRVRYHDYRPAGESRVPGRIVLDDFEGDYRLTLWLEEARRL